MSARRVVLTGAQLLEALDFIAPDRETDAEQLESEVTIVYLEAHEAPIDDDKKRMPEGLYMFITDYPEEGCVPLFEVTT